MCRCFCFENGSRTSRGTAKLNRGNGRPKLQLDSPQLSFLQVELGQQQRRDPRLASLVNGAGQVHPLLLERRQLLASLRGGGGEPGIILLLEVERLAILRLEGQVLVIRLLSVIRIQADLTYRNAIQIPGIMGGLYR